MRGIFTSRVADFHLIGGTSNGTLYKAPFYQCTQRTIISYTRPTYRQFSPPFWYRNHLLLRLELVFLIAIGPVNSLLVLLQQTLAVQLLRRRDKALYVKSEMNNLRSES